MLLGVGNDGYLGDFCQWKRAEILLPVVGDLRVWYGFEYMTKEFTAQ